MLLSETVKVDKDCILWISLVLAEMLSVSESVAPKYRPKEYQPCPFNRVLVMSSSGDKSCKRCSVCPRGFEISQKCSSYNDTVCKSCATGTYNNQRGGYCKQCTGCEAGKYLRRNCTTRRDTSCRKCPRNMFTANLNVTRCLYCKRCQPNEHEISRCGGLKDTVCGECKKGFFRESVSDACLPCSKCPREYSRLVVKECREQLGWQHSHICRPGYSYTHEKDYFDVGDLETFQEDIIMEATKGERYTENTARKLHEKLTVILPVFGAFVVIVFVLAGFLGLRTQFTCSGRLLRTPALHQPQQPAADIPNPERSTTDIRLDMSTNETAFDSHSLCDESCVLDSAQESDKDSYIAWNDIRQNWTSEGNTSSAPDVTKHKEDKLSSPKYYVYPGKIMSKRDFSDFVTM